VPVAVPHPALYSKTMYIYRPYFCFDIFGIYLLSPIVMDCGLRLVVAAHRI
jgi:hypothetical protein